MVMEYLDGKDLAEMLRLRGALPLGEAVEYVLQACEALAEAHRAGVVHRDLKPANLFLSSRADGSAIVKVLDFGISKASLTSGFEHANLTQTSAVMGSPNYMSPEQLRNSKTVDARADIWSLGLVLYELLTGQVAFRADTLAELHVAILQNIPSPLRERRPDLPPSLELLILRCLNKDPAFRFASVAELAQALAEFTPPRAFVSIERICRVLGVPLAIQAPSGVGPGSGPVPQTTASPGSGPSWNSPTSAASGWAPPPGQPIATPPPGWAPAQGGPAGWPQAPQPIVPAFPSYAQNAQPWGTGAASPGYAQTVMRAPNQQAQRPGSSPSPLAIVGLIAIVICVVGFSGCLMCVCISTLGQR
jgi:serine/threonine-protein kinase